MLHDYSFRLLAHLSNSDQYKDRAPTVCIGGRVFRWALFRVLCCVPYSIWHSPVDYCLVRSATWEYAAKYLLKSPPCLPVSGIQWNLLIRTLSGPAVPSFVERLSSFQK